MIYARIAGIVLAVVFIFGAGWYFRGLKATAAAEAIQAANAISLAKAYQDREAAQQAKQAAYDKEIDDLKTDALNYPTVAVRMCPPVSTVPAANQRGQVLPAPAGVGKGNPIEVPSSSRQDIGPSLFGLADALDQIAAKCR